MLFAHFRKNTANAKKAGKPPRFLFASSTRNLPPVPFLKHPAIVAMDPAMRFPPGARMGRTVPAAGNPYIAVAVPVMVAGDPHVAALRRWGATLNNRGWRSNADNDLRERNCRRQAKGK